MTTENTVRIVKTPGVIGGKARIDGTRIAVQLVWSYLHGHEPRTIEEFLADYPHLTREQVQAALDYAAKYPAERGARDPERIRPLLDALETLWRRYPDMRLGQLIEVVAEANGAGDFVFYIEDDALFHAIRTWAP